MMRALQMETTSRLTQILAVFLVALYLRNLHLKAIETEPLTHVRACFNWSEREYASVCHVISISSFMRRSKRMKEHILITFSDFHQRSATEHC